MLYLCPLFRVASKNNSLFVTPNQVYSSFMSIIYKKNRISYIPFIISAVIILLMLFLYFIKDSKSAMVFGSLIVIADFVYFIIKMAVRKPIPSKKLVMSWIKSISLKRIGDQILTTHRLKKAPPEWKEPDIYDYGFERILVVQRDLLVDLFVKNNFHSEEAYFDYFIQWFILHI